MLEAKINSTSYKNCIEYLKVSGSIKDSSRKIEMTIYTKDDIDTGNEIEIYSDNTNIFTGMIFDVTRDRFKNKIKIKAYDNAISLNRSKFLKNFYQKTPSEITKEILAELNIEIGEMPSDTTRCTFYAFDRSGYEIISRAYELQEKNTNKSYSIFSEKGKIKIIEQGEEIADLVLDSKKNMIESNYGKNIESIVNRIVYYQSGKNSEQIVNTVNDSDSISKYGVFQQLVEKQDKTDNFLDSSKFLKTINENASLMVVGDIRLKSGYLVSVRVDSNQNLTGKFLIETDTHIWQGSSYKTALTLKFDSVGDE